MKLTAVVGQPRHHDAGADPVLQGQRAHHGRRLQVLRVGRRQLREAAVGDRGVRQRVHGRGVQAGHRTRVGEGEHARLGDDSRREVSAPRGGGLRRAARGAVAARSRGRGSAQPVALVGEQGVDSEVFRLLHDRCPGRDTCRVSSHGVLSLWRDGRHGPRLRVSQVERVSVSVLHPCGPDWLEAGGWAAPTASYQLISRSFPPQKPLSMR